MADITADVTGNGPWTIDYTVDGVAQIASGATSPINLGNAPGVYVVTNITDATCNNTATGTQTIRFLYDANSECSKWTLINARWM